MQQPSDERESGEQAATDLVWLAVAAVRAGSTPPAGASIALLDSLGVEIAGSRYERAIADDQTNASVVVGERHIVKWLREAHSVDPARPVAEHLAAVGFSDAPALVATLRDASGTRAVVHEFVPGAVDGWTWCVDEALAELSGRPTNGWAHAMGDLAGRLAVGFATPSSVAPEPVVAHVSVETLITSSASEIVAAARFAAGQELVALWNAATKPARPESIPVTMSHGDLHVGQILRSERGYVIVDFEGDPRQGGSLSEPSDADLAHLLVSIELVGSVAARRLGSEARVAGWVDERRREVLAAYLERLASADLMWQHRPDLLSVLELRQLARELEYAAAFLPRFEYASAAAIARRGATLKMESA